MTDEKNEKPPTMRAQIDEIHEMMQRLRRPAQPEPPAPPRPVAEAAALADCIRALDALVESERNARSTTFNPGVWLTATSVDRILRHLASKYGVQLIEQTIEPCNRPHLDALDDVALGQAVRQAVQP